LSKHLKTIIMKTLGLILAILIYLGLFAGFMGIILLDAGILRGVSVLFISIYLGSKIMGDAIGFYQWFKSNLK
jgi:hypothetical protein